VLVSIPTLVIQFWMRYARKRMNLAEISRMQISEEQGIVLNDFSRSHWRSLGNRVGTFTGYSSICIARG